MSLSKQKAKKVKPESNGINWENLEMARSKKATEDEKSYRLENVVKILNENNNHETGS